MADYRDTFTSEIYVNKSQAEDAIEKYTKKLEDLNKKLAAIDKSQDGWQKQEKKLQRQIKSTEATLKGVQTGVENYQKAMNNLDGRSIANLIKLKKQLNAEIRKLVPGTQEYIRMTQDLKKVEARIKSLTTATQSMSTKITSFFTKYWTMFDTLSKSITGLSMKFRQAAEDAAKLDDVYSDVMKTTGLLHDEVRELDKALMQINTRTSREQLLLLARDAGKLGIQGKENILGFVRAADQIQVALGEDLGEGAIRNLGKIADVLGYTQQMGVEKSLLSIASAVNAVGQASTASEAYLVDFTQRLAGVAAQTGISAANIIGFASGLDQSAMKVEMASTAFQKFLMKLYEDPAKFAEYANLEVEKFTELLSKDANEAVITIMKSLNNKDGFASLVPIFKDMGLDGARAVGVLSAMATNIKAVTEAQALANVEFDKATSVTEEYNVKNNNLQANLEKARKEFKNASIALGQSLNPILLKSTKLTTYLIKALATYGKEIKAAAITVAALTLAVKASTIAHTVYHAVVKGITAIQGTFTVAVNAASYAINIMRGRTVAATKAYLAMKAAMSTSVFGAIATAVSALVVVITRLINKEKEAANAMTYVQSVEKKVVETYAEEEARLRTLHGIVRDNTISIDQRRKALKDLQEIVPEYHASLDKEGKLIEGNTVFLEKYIEKLREATRWQVYKDEWQELEKQLIEVQDEIAKAEQQAQNELVRNGGNRTEKVTTIVDTWGGGSKVQEEYTQYGKYMRTVAFYQEKETNLLSQQKEIRAKMGQMSKNETKELTEQEKEIQAVEQKYEHLFAEARNAYVGAPAEGMKAMGKLQEQMDKEIAEIRKKYASPSTASTIVSGDGSGADGAGGKGNKEDSAYKKALDALKRHKIARENLVKELYANNQLTKEEYDEKMIEINMKYLERQVELAKEYGEDETQVLSAFLDAQIAANERANKEIDDLFKQRNDWEKAQLEEYEAYQKKYLELVAEGEKVKDTLHPDAARAKEMQSELDKLNELHKAKILSEKDYEEAVKQLRKRYADEDLQMKLSNVQHYVEQSNSLMQGASNLVTALQDAELANAEADYQAQLTAAGDNAEKREQVEAEHEAKKLEIQKKYADVDMGINIAKTIAAGALAAIQAFAQLGPIAGAVMAAVIAVTTAAEVATIVRQRNAIKNSSVNSASSGSSSTPETGTRTITGYAGGGFTENHTTLTTVGEEGTEWIAPHWMVKEKPATFANLERYRKAGSHGRKGSVRRGFADGGFTDQSASSMVPSSALSEIDFQTMREFNEIMRYCAENGIFVKYGDILIAEGKHKYFKKQTSR